jgi:hypothetical protein
MKEHRQGISLPETAAGVLVGCYERIVGIDLFDSSSTFKSLWDRFADTYFFAALRDPGPAPATPGGLALWCIDRLGGAARPRLPALALGEEVEIGGRGLAGTALLHEGELCHLAAFSVEE